MTREEMATIFADENKVLYLKRIPMEVLANMLKGRTPQEGAELYKAIQQASREIEAKEKAKKEEVEKYFCPICHINDKEEIKIPTEGELIIKAIDDCIEKLSMLREVIIDISTEEDEEDEEVDEEKMYEDATEDVQLNDIFTKIFSNLIK
jgi:Zn finger protein HypA/HybF involved in hydrogenase expression